MVPTSQLEGLLSSSRKDQCGTTAPRPGKSSDTIWLGRIGRKQKGSSTLTQLRPKTQVHSYTLS